MLARTHTLKPRAGAASGSRRDAASPLLARRRRAGSKTATQASRSAEALFRHCPARNPIPHVIPYRVADNPSRSRHREARAGVAVFRASGRGAANLTRPRRKRVEGWVRFAPRCGSASARRRKAGGRKRGAPLEYCRCERGTTRWQSRSAALQIGAGSCELEVGSWKLTPVDLRRTVKVEPERRPAGTLHPQTDAKLLPPAHRLRRPSCFGECGQTRKRQVLEVPDVRQRL